VSENRFHDFSRKINRGIIQGSIRPVDHHDYRMPPSYRPSSVVLLMLFPTSAV
jgi:hypothetical protein